MSLALKVSGLSAGYGRKTVIEDVALDFAPGRIHLILGHNGAGKTTLARALFGLVTPGKGSILLNGREIAGTRPDRNVAAGIAYIPQRHGVFRGLSVSDNLKLGGYTEPQDHLLRERRDKVLALFPQLSQRLGQRAGSMSGGQQQMVAIGMALMHAPQLIILDEPSIGLAPLMVDKVMESVQHINREMGATIVLVEQNVKAALPIADHVAILKTGRVVYDGMAEPLFDHVQLMHYF